MINYIKTKIIEPIENNPASTGCWLLFFAVVILLRNFGDGLAWTYTIGHETHPSYPHFFSILKVFNAYALVHIEMYLIVCCIMYFLTKENILKISKVVIVFWIISWIVPLWDYITIGGHPLQYGTDISNLPHVLLNFFNPFVRFERHSIGHKLELLFLCVGVATYVWIKSRNLLKTIAGGILSYLSFIILMGFIHVTIMTPIYIIFPVFLEYVPEELAGASLGDKLMGTPGLIFTNTQITGILLMIIIIFFLLIWFRVYAGKRNFINWVQNINWFKGLNYMSLTVAGIVFGIWRMENVRSNAFHNPIDYFASFMLCLAVFFAYLHVCAIRGIIVKKKVRALNWASFKEQKIIIAALLFLALFAALNVTYWCLLYLIVFILIFYFIMLPPLRIERLPVISNIFLALTYMFAFFTGFGLLADREAVHLLPGHLWKAGFLAFALASAIKYKSRMQTKNLKILLGSMVFLAFVIVPFLLELKVLIIPAVIFGILEVFIVIRKKWQPAYFFSLAIIYYGIIMFSVNKYVKIQL